MILCCLALLIFKNIMWICFIVNVFLCSFSIAQTHTHGPNWKWFLWAWNFLIKASCGTSLRPVGPESTKEHMVSCEGWDSFPSDIDSIVHHRSCFMGTKSNFLISLLVSRILFFSILRLINLGGAKRFDWNQLEFKWNVEIGFLCSLKVCVDDKANRRSLIRPRMETDKTTEFLKG